MNKIKQEINDYLKDIDTQIEERNNKINEDESLDVYQKDEIYEEIEPLLMKGSILSFSTQSRGHTGIVSQKNQYWTYINSGMMDHHVGSQSDLKRVGEEFLADEIKNWVKLAAKRDEPLRVTLGRLNGRQLGGIKTSGL